MKRLFRAIHRWQEMIKLAHSVFALPFALMATFLAAGQAYRAGELAHRYPGFWQVMLIIGCMVTARSSAMTFNRIVDAHYDARNQRTAGRAIPAGEISIQQAWLFWLIASAGFVLFCAGFVWLQGNFIPLILSLPVLMYLCFYSYTKRFTRWSHFVLGSAIALSPGAAWLAIHPASFGFEALLLMGASMLWIGGFDVIYACQDLAFDQQAGLFSLPASLGMRKALIISRIAHAGTVICLAGLLPVAGLSWLFGVGVFIVAVLLVVEHLLVQPDNPSRIGAVFLTVNGTISLILGVLTIADCLIL